MMFLKLSRNRGLHQGSVNINIPDSIMLDLEDAVAENQKDAAEIFPYIMRFRRSITAA